MQVGPGPRRAVVLGVVQPFLLLSLGRAQVQGSSIYLGKLFFHHLVPSSPKLLEPWEQQCQVGGQGLCWYPTTVFLYPVTDGLSNLFIETLISSSQQAEFSEGPSDMASSPPLPPYNAVICSLAGMNTSRHPPLRNNTAAS